MKAPAFLNPYFTGFIVLYIANLAFAGSFHLFETSDAIGILLVFGFGFSGIAWLLSRRAKALVESKPAQKREEWVLLALPVYISIAIVLGNKIFLLPQDQAGVTKEMATICRKVLTFVLIPYALYRFLFRYKWEYFGLSTHWRAVFSRTNILLFVVLSLLVLLLNYYGGRGAQPIREGLFSTKQLLVGLPLLFCWLFIEAGLVEEFFFRGLLQNRLSALLKSEWGGICASALIFGLAHAPGMYLRGAGAVEGLGNSPGLLTCISYCMAIQAVPAFFFGALWYRTKNLWLLMGIHAMVDLLPNFPDFVRVWGI